MNGEILEMKDDEVLVHYTGFAKKFDRWIPLRPSHILKQ